MKRGKARGKKLSTGMIVWIIIAVIIVLIILMSAIVSVSDRKGVGKNVALIHIDGSIMVARQQGLLPSTATYADEAIKEIESAVKNPNFKAIIVEINSPGGSAVASNEIADAIKKASEEKMTVALIREVGASGGYWVASACDHVIAHPMSITGSIGVLASYLEISGLLEQYNVTYESLNAGKHKDAMSPFRELTPEERSLIQRKINLIYEGFVQAVAENRNLNEQEVRRMATGIFYLGQEAKDLGLVDQLGSKDDAISYLEQQLEEEVSIYEYKKSKSFVEKMLGLSFPYWMGRGIAAELVDQGQTNILQIRT